jgi:hypothetical protein
VASGTSPHEILTDETETPLADADAGAAVGLTDPSGFRTIRSTYVLLSAPLGRVILMGIAFIPTFTEIEEEAPDLTAAESMKIAAWVSTAAGLTVMTLSKNDTVSLRVSGKIPETFLSVPAERLSDASEALAAERRSTDSV